MKRRRSRPCTFGASANQDVVAARISTVDNLESVSGLTAVMLSLDDLGRDRRGHYGIGPGAESQLPQP